MLSLFSLFLSLPRYLSSISTSFSSPLLSILLFISLPFSLSFFLFLFLFLFSFFLFLFPLLFLSLHLTPSIKKAQVVACVVDDFGSLFWFRNRGFFRKSSSMALGLGDNFFCIAHPTSKSSFKFQRCSLEKGFMVKSESLEQKKGLTGTYVPDASKIILFRIGDSGITVVSTQNWKRLCVIPYQTGLISNLIPIDSSAKKFFILEKEKLRLVNDSGKVIFKFKDPQFQFNRLVSSEKFGVMIFHRFNAPSIVFDIQTLTTKYIIPHLGGNPAVKSGVGFIRGGSSIMALNSHGTGFNVFYTDFNRSAINCLLLIREKVSHSPLHKSHFPLDLFKIIIRLAFY